MTHHRSHRPSRGRQQGVVLLVALLMLIAITALSTTAVTTGVMEMRMAHNQESSKDTFQTAVAAVDFVLSDPAHLPSVGPLNQPAVIALAGSPFGVVGVDTAIARATRLEDCGLPPRMTRATSLTAYSSFKYEATAAIQKNGSGMGQSEMNQGFLLLGPKC